MASQPEDRDQKPVKLYGQLLKVPAKKNAAYTFWRVNLKTPLSVVGNEITHSSFYLLRLGANMKYKAKYKTCTISVYKISTMLWLFVLQERVATTSRQTERCACKSLFW